MVDAVHLVKELIGYGLSQEFLNRRFKSDVLIPVPYKHIKSIILDDGSIFPVGTKDDLTHFLWIKEDYRFDDIRKEDIVIDLGANIGGFCIPASRKSDHVYAVEPLFGQELRHNIALNRVTVTVIDAAMGPEGTIKLGYLQKKKRGVPSFPFSEIKKVAGGCDFLKCDCEGAEHLLTRDDLKGVRRIELELHGNPRSESAFLNMIAHDFEYTYTCVYSGRLVGSLGFVHATRKEQ